jgi:hypothetical protein
MLEGVTTELKAVLPGESFHRMRKLPVANQV